jgi:hypothetical protein
VNLQSPPYFAVPQTHLFYLLLPTRPLERHIFFIVLPLQHRDTCISRIHSLLTLHFPSHSSAQLQPTSRFPWLQFLVRNNWTLTWDSQLTSQLTLTSWVPGKLIVAYVGNKFLILWKLRFHYRIHNSLPYGSVLGQLNTRYIFTAHLTSILILFSSLHLLKGCARNRFVHNSRLASYFKKKNTHLPKT